MALQILAWNNIELPWWVVTFPVAKQLRSNNSSNLLFCTTAPVLGALTNYVLIIKVTSFVFSIWKRLPMLDVFLPLFSALVLCSLQNPA